MPWLGGVNQVGESTNCRMFDDKVTKIVFYGPLKIVRRGMKYRGKQSYFETGQWLFSLHVSCVFLRRGWQTRLH